MPAPSPHGSRRAAAGIAPGSSDSLASATHHSAIPRREVGLVDPALHARPRFPLRAVAACQPLPHVNGPAVSEYYGLIRPPMGLRLPYHFSFRVRLPAPGPIVGNPMYRPSAGTHRVSQVPDASLHTCHALRGPRQTLGELTRNALSVLASPARTSGRCGSVTPSPPALSSLSGLYQDFRECRRSRVLQRGGLPCGLCGSLGTLQLSRSVL